MGSLTIILITTITNSEKDICFNCGGNPSHVWDISTISKSQTLGEREFRGSPNSLKYSLSGNHQHLYSMCAKPLIRCWEISVWTKREWTSNKPATATHITSNTNWKIMYFQDRNYLLFSTVKKKHLKTWLLRKYKLNISKTKMMRWWKV